jgi:hypothetical protein
VPENSRVAACNSLIQTHFVQQATTNRAQQRTGVAYNSAGEKRVILVTKKIQEANDRAIIMENDFKALGEAAWCERYKAPPSVVSE